MRTLPDFRTARRIVFTLALALVTVATLTGCDASGDFADDATFQISPEETAESIALSVADRPGGDVDELSMPVAMLTTGSASDAMKDFTRDRECTYDAGVQLWSCTATRGGSGGPITNVSASRTFEVQFYNDGAVVRRPADADSARYALIEGSGEFASERVRNQYTQRPATWAVSVSDDDTYGLTLLSDEAGRDVEATFTGTNALRARTAQVRRTAVSGLVWQQEVGPIAGTVEGTYAATVEFERADGATRTRSVNATYVITFSEDGAELTFTGGGDRFNGRVFAFDIQSGLLR